MSIQIRRQGAKGIPWASIGQLEKRLSLACMCSVLKSLKAEETAFSSILNTDRSLVLDYHSDPWLFSSPAGHSSGSIDGVN